MLRPSRSKLCLENTLLVCIARMCLTVCDVMGKNNSRDNAAGDPFAAQQEMTGHTVSTNVRWMEHSPEPSICQHRGAREAVPEHTRQRTPRRLAAAGQVEQRSGHGVCLLDAGDVQLV